MKGRGFRTMVMVLAAVLAATFATGDAQAFTCPNTVTAKVVILDTPILFNRLGAQNVNWMTYALRRDVVDTADVPLTQDGAVNPGAVMVRADKRIRPLVLRVNEGDCLEIQFENLLANNANPFVADPAALQINDQVRGRYAGFHVQGLNLVGNITSDASNVGAQGVVGAGVSPKNGLVKPGDSFTYTYYAPPGTRGTYLAHSYGATFGGEASAGNAGVGAFAAVNVEPKGARWYRSQVTEEEMRLATTGTTAGGQPILDYEAVYPATNPDSTTSVWVAEGKDGLPVLNMLNGNEIVHSDLNAIIAYKDGATFTDFPANTYPLESVGKRNPTVPNRLEPFREFTVIFHDENAVAQAFPAFFNHPVLRHTLHGVRDSFLINYGSGGIGSEIIANRLGVGPMHDCLSCSYEEFFLTSFTVGDPAMLVDTPANMGLETCGPDSGNCTDVGPKATKAFYPDDPSNVHHSYVSDRVVFRNLHAGKEQHVFHLHNHQWLFDANDDNSNYLDAQGIGPGSGYTYEINFGGAGNRNKSAGDAIFHCHFYPHFAQGMWEHWRIQDVFETGTRLAVTGPATGNIYHTTPFALFDGTPALHPTIAGARMRALPDGEILVGTPIPAVVPLPTRPMAVMPGEVVIVAKDADSDTVMDSSQAHVVDRTKNPGYPFWIAGIDCGLEFATTGLCAQGIVGQRPPTPPLDMTAAPNPVDGGWDGGLPRHSLAGFLSVGGRIDNGSNPAAGGVFHQVQTRLSFEKEIFKAKAVWFPEEGTDLEKLAMKFHGDDTYPGRTGAFHSTYLPDGTPATGTGGFRVNGAPSVPGAPFFEPCIDDDARLLGDGITGNFFDGNGGKSVTGRSTYNALNPRLYKAANVQIDAIFNKVGYHYPQQRIIALWEDVFDTINKVKAPQPFVIRSNTFDCTDYLHTNLVPKFFEMDDYQVKTPTDIIGQHIHLPKWDLVSSDGSGNGWNYEDGTLSPGMVQERIHAINTVNPSGAGNPANSTGTGAGAPLVALPHPFFGIGEEIPDGHGGFMNEYRGARTTIQRWFFDPVVNVASVDRGLGIIFTHDHYGPSTHQQVGLYASVLTEPAGSVWVHNETGEQLGTGPDGSNPSGRADGGPTAWQAIIRPGTPNGHTVAQFETFREFWFQYGDFQHAYEAGVYVGAGPDGRPNGVVPDATTFVNSINPSYRQTAGPIFPDIMKFPQQCPGGVLRPCPEAISADDVGMLVVNYRNEPVGLRVYDPLKLGPDGKLGTQAQSEDLNGNGILDGGEDTNLNGILDIDPKRGDLAFALQSRTDRAIALLNRQPILGDPAFYPIDLNATGAREPGDPFTPMMRVHPGDLVRIKTQAGSTEHEHNWAIHGLKWLQGGSGHGQAPNSGWRNVQNGGISEQFTFRAPVITAPRQITGHNDHAYTADSSQDGWWTGIWGILRAYQGGQPNLQVIGFDRAPRIVNVDEFIGVCPLDRDLSTRNNPVPKNRRPYTVIAMLANELLCTRNAAGNCDGNPLGVTIPPNTNRNSDGIAGGDNEGAPLNTAGGTLVYNPRTTALNNGKSGPLHDPTAILYVLADDLVPVDPFDPACGGLRGNRNRPPVAGNQVQNPACRVRLKAGVNPEPPVLRAAADDCVEVTLFNRLPAVVPDLAGVNTLLQVVNRDRDDPVNGLTTFQNNLVRPSSHIGLHTQLLAYDVSQHDGACVGINNCGNGINTVGPVVAGALDKAVTYRWYAGDVAFEPQGNGVRLVATPVEFGGVNLQPADKIKQGQKGLVGALAVHPQGSTWTTASTGAPRASATVSQGSVPNPQFTPFRDFAVVLQKGLNHRYSDGTYIQNIASEGQGIPEDSHDAGQMAINYKTEPLWFRFGIRPDAPFGAGGFGNIANPEDAYSNFLAGSGGDPVTPIFTASAGQETRFHVLMPTGVGRGSIWHQHGHLWQRAPYVCPGSNDLGLFGKCTAGEVGSRAIGENPIGMYLGAQESVTPSAHFTIRLPEAGGADAATLTSGGPVDFLYRDQGSFGNTSGLWGILRVTPPPPSP